MTRTLTPSHGPGHPPSHQPDALLGWMDSLADETRLRLLRLLERHELGVVELCDILQLPQSTVSRHLKVLADGGWAHSRAAGTTHLYRMLLDEIDPAARQLWLLAREQTEGWATVAAGRAAPAARRLRDSETDSQAFFAGAAGPVGQAARPSFTARPSPARPSPPCCRRTGSWPTSAAAPARCRPNSPRTSAR